MREMAAVMAMPASTIRISAAARCRPTLAKSTPRSASHISTVDTASLAATLITRRDFVFDGFAPTSSCTVCGSCDAAALLAGAALFSIGSAGLCRGRGHISNRAFAEQRDILLRDVVPRIRRDHAFACGGAQRMGQAGIGDEAREACREQRGRGEVKEQARLVGGD